MIYWYQPRKETAMPGSPRHFEIERVQTGVRMERRILKEKP